ncbi:DUF6225 family protein [Streptomyces sp. NPDC055078]
MAETFDHAPQVWTVARLREALADLPDGTPVHVGVADAPGDFGGYSEYALVDLEPVEKDLPGTRGGTEVEYTLFADYKAGQYHRDLV